MVTIDERDLKGLVEVLNEAADILEAVGQSVPDVVERCKNWRWPLADELSGFACMLADAWQRAQSAPVVPEVAATLFRALVDDFKSFAVIGDCQHDGGEFYRKEPLYLAAPQPAAPVAECTNEDSWNCKYCRKTETCAALKDERNFGAPPKAARHDQGDEVQRLREALELARPYLINAQATFGAGMHEEVSRRLKIIDAALSASAEGKA